MGAMTAPPIEMYPIWFGPPHLAMRGWVHEPANKLDNENHANENHIDKSQVDKNLRAERNTLATEPLARCAHAVVIVPSFGYEELTVGNGLRVFADMLTSFGMRVLRYDHPGTGDSADSADSDSAHSNANQWDCWRSGLQTAITATHADRVTLVGVRLGAALALDYARTSPIDEVVLFDPVLSGRQFIRTLTMLGAASATSTASTGDSSNEDCSSESKNAASLVVGGFRYASSLTSAIRTLDLRTPSQPPARWVNIIFDSEKSADMGFIATLEALHCETTVLRSPLRKQWIEQSSELARSPIETFEHLATLLVSHTDADANSGTTRMQTAKALQFEAVANDSVGPSHDQCYCETPMQIGTAKLSGVLVSPRHNIGKNTAVYVTNGVAVLLCNSGVERNVGPGRAWVELARTWASEEQRTVLRLDLSGVGNSGTWPHQKAMQTYCSENVHDIEEGIRTLRQHGHHRIVVVGLCAGAFSALATPPTDGFTACIAINPQMYRCGTPPGNETLSAQETNYRRYRLAKLDAAFGLRRKLTTVSELVGRSHESARWMKRLTASHTSVHLIFGSEDRGLRFLEWRAPLALSRLATRANFSLEIISGLDHALHAPHARNNAIKRIRELVTSLDTST
jgi:pimeloyl-ACP methyl ester carboxylesterase